MIPHVGLIRFVGGPWNNSVRNVTWFHHFEVPVIPHPEPVESFFDVMDNTPLAFSTTVYTLHQLQSACGSFYYEYHVSLEETIYNGASGTSYERQSHPLVTSEQSNRGKLIMKTNMTQEEIRSKRLELIEQLNDTKAKLSQLQFMCFHKYEGDRCVDCGRWKCGE